MLDGAILVPLLQTVYSFLYEMAAIGWGFQRALLLTGYVVMAITEWLRSAFMPLLGALGAQTGVLLGPIFTIAMLILAGTYLMGVFLRIRVVEFRSAIVWLLLALLLFQGGPQLYQGTEEMRRGIASAFYQEGLTILSRGGGALAALNTIGSGAEAAIPAPSNQFAPFLSSDRYVDGLDVAMSYLGADGYDVVAPADAPHPIDRLPWSWLSAGGYFDPATGAAAFPDLSREQRETSIGRAVQASARLIMGCLISIFGVLEQIIHLALALAMGLAFASSFIAILFAFFKHTEVLVWSVLNLMIELFVQSVLMSLFLSLIISFVLVGAVTGNAVVTLGTVLIGLILVVILLAAALRAIWNGINRLFGAMGQVTGGTITPPGPVALGAASLAGGSALGLVGGGLALTSGNSLMQAAGIALGNNTGLTRAAYLTSMLPGLRETAFGQAASEFAEGALARSALGPVVSAAVLPPRRRLGLEDERADIRDYYRQPDSELRQSRLTAAFGSAAHHLAQVLDAHTEDEFLEIADAVHAVRRANPSLPASSPAFQSAVENRLPGDIAGRFNPDELRLAISTLGSLPGEGDRQRLREQHEEERPQRALRDYYAAEDKTAALTGLQNSFSPVATPELAHVLDAHTEEDMTAVASAIQSLRGAHPEAIPTSEAFIQALANRLLGVTSVPLDDTTLRTLTRGLTSDPRQQLIDTPLLASGIATALAGYQQLGAQPHSFQQAAATVAQSIGLPADQPRPFGSHTAAVGHFFMQASALQLSPQQAQQAVIETRQTGHLTPDLRTRLLESDSASGRSADDMNRAVRALEAAARALPHSLITGSVMPAPVAPPVTLQATINPGGVTALEMEAGHDPAI